VFEFAEKFRFPSAVIVECFIGNAVDVGGFLDVWPQEDANAVPADKSVKVVCFSDDGGKQTVAARLVSEGVRGFDPQTARRVAWVDVGFSQDRSSGS
jgi:hypothetical protein